MRIFLLLATLVIAQIPVLAHDATVDLLPELADAAGPPGFEDPVRKAMVERMKPLAASIQFDGMGSIIAKHWGRFGGDSEE